MRGKKSLPGAEEAGGGVAAHGRRLQAVALLFKRQRERDFFLFPSPLVFSLFLSLFCLPVIIPLSSPFCFKKNFPPKYQASLNLSFLSLFHSFLFGLYLLVPPSVCSLGSFSPPRVLALSLHL